MNYYVLSLSNGDVSGFSKNGKGLKLTPEKKRHTVLHGPRSSQSVPSVMSPSALTPSLHIQVQHLSPQIIDLVYQYSKLFHITVQNKYVYL